MHSHEHDLVQRPVHAKSVSILPIQRRTFDVKTDRGGGDWAGKTGCDGGSDPTGKETREQRKRRERDYLG
jgi:hypothetical protein